ncbi:MAG: TfoX/Sxy family protein [Deltaproteobacteria bacterium]|nr:TfoX/Sxy family protein [Deltaproteobacteria bacterium]
MKSREKAARTPKLDRPKRPPPLHQATLEESITRLGLRGVTKKRMFGGLCYYAEGNPFSITLGDSLALKLPAEQLRAGCEQGDGQLFHPGGGDFVMREYLELSDQALMDEGRVDAYVLASHRFIAGQGAPEEDLAWSDLLQGRDGLYKRVKEKQ